MNIKGSTMAGFGPIAWDSSVQPLHSFTNTRPYEQERGHTQKTGQNKPVSTHAVHLNVADIEGIIFKTSILKKWITSSHRWRLQHSWLPNRAQRRFCSS